MNYLKCSRCLGNPECVCDDVEHHEHEPNKCPSCGGDWFAERVTNYVEHIVAEFEVSCVWCHDDVAYWAYGYYQPPIR